MAYPINLAEFPALADSIRYEFYDDQETRLELAWRSGAVLIAIWPTEDSTETRPYFYLESLKGIQPRSPATVRTSFPPLGVIPVLMPVEHTESVLQEKYLRANINSRLSSPHFRNNIYLMQREAVLIDKRRKRGIRTKTVELEEQIGSALGTQFNLRLAKALRSKLVVFVEGEDLKLLRPLFRTLGLEKLTREKGVSFVDLGGFSMWEHLAPFEWFVKDLLKDSVVSAVLLDRDYRSDSQIEDLEQTMSKTGLIPHIWRRKEIESYLATIPIISRATGYSKQDVADVFSEVVEDLENTVFSRLVAEAIQAKGGGSQYHATVTSAIKQEFDAGWLLNEYRQKVVPPKQLLSGINLKFQDLGKKAVSIRALAGSARRSDLDAEIIDALSEIEKRLD